MTKIKESFLKSLIKRVQELRRAQGFKLLYAIGRALNEKKVSETKRPTLRKRIISDIRRIEKDSTDVRKLIIQIRSEIDPKTGLSPVQKAAQEDIISVN